MPSLLEQDVTILARRLWLARLSGNERDATRYAERLNALLLAASGFEHEADTLTDVGQYTIVGGLDAPVAA